MAFLAAAAALSSLSSCSGSRAAQPRDRERVEKKVRVEAVRQEDLHRTIDVVGTLTAADEATISSEAEGRVSRLLADLGDRVKEGQGLIELDHEKLDYGYEQQKASLARALAQFGAADTTHLPPLEQTPDVQKASAELVQAQQAFDRAQELNRRELVPKQTLDDADAMLQSKRASYTSALQNAKNLKASIDASDASVKLADRQRRDATIRAPFDGYVSQRLVSLGQFVKNQMPVMTVVRVDPLKVTAEIPEKMAPWIRIGQIVDLHVEAYPDKALSGRISRISPSVNPATRSFPFEALAPNGDGVLKPGTFARIRIDTSKVDRVLTLSGAALQYRYGVYRIFAVGPDNKLVSHEVQLGDRVADRVEILGGARAGDRIAMTDVDNLTDGLSVTITPSKD
jgi:RND family efflux transporter MFP subunit